MSFLPLPDPFGILIPPEIILVLRPGQPGFLAGLFPGLLTSGLGTKTLPFPMPVIRKKQLVAVKAFTAALRSLHRFENQTGQSEEKSEE